VIKRSDMADVGYGRTGSGPLAGSIRTFYG
jgi:hypothetical protein